MPRTLFQDAIVPLRRKLAEIEVLRADAALASGREEAIADACQRAGAAREVIAAILSEGDPDRAYATAVGAACVDAGHGAAPTHEERQRALAVLIQRYGAQHALVLAMRDHLG